MRALHIPSAGEQPTIGELPIPQPGPGQVLVKVKAAGLNPLDNLVAAGFLSGMLPHEYPVVLGRDGAGIVEQIGEGVEGIVPGQRVVGNIPLNPPIQAGTLAEYAILPVTGVVPLPEGLDFVVAAALPLASTAAWRTVELISPSEGDVVLVNGATGGVGQFVIQLFVARGAVVVATGTEEDVEQLRALGASDVVDYTAGPVSEQVRALYPDGVDALVNLIGPETAPTPFEAVRAGGTVASTTMPAPDADAIAAAGLTGDRVAADPSRETIAPNVALAADGELDVVIESVLSLEQATEGLGRLAAAVARGKIVVSISD